MPFYTTSKHGVVGLLKAASAELGASGIRINAVCLSPTYTGMMMEGGASIDQINQCEIAKMTVLGRVGKAREIGEMVRFLGSDAASYMTGGVHPIDGGMTAAGRKPI
jgi:NAD(P)-dependent dehydrogenase (short-subunit alcohol dehydrogenase family)